MFRIKTVFMVLAVLCLSIGALEAMLWLVPLPDPYPSLPTGKFHRFLESWNHWAWSPWWTRKEPPFEGVFNPGYLNNMERKLVHYKVNRFGFLYPEEKGSRIHENELRIAVIGGSTVECIALQSERRWPAVLERFFREDQPGREITVLNLGLSGTETPAYLSTVAHHAVNLDLDILVFMLGANDMIRAAFTEREFMLSGRGFYWLKSNEPNTLSRIVTRTQLGRRLLAAFCNSRFRGSAKPYFEVAKDQRMKRPLLPFEPAFKESTLEEYERYIISLAGLAEAHGIKVLFTTQPMLWKAEMSPEEEKVLWLAQYNHKGIIYRLEPGTAARLLGTLNERLLKVCREKGYPYLDLSELIPHTLDIFYDDVHFNEKGAETVAELVRDALRNHLLSDSRS